MRLFLSISVIIIFLLGCSPATRFGAGVDITFDPRTIGMQIDDTIMQKNLVARLSLNEKKYFINIIRISICNRIIDIKLPSTK